MTGLFEAIERGDFPCRKLHIQVMPEKDADTCNIHPFDLTKVWTHMDYSRMTREMTISPEELPRSKDSVKASRYERPRPNASPTHRISRRWSTTMYRQSKGRRRAGRYPPNRSPGREAALAR